MFSSGPSLIILGAGEVIDEGLPSGLQEVTSNGRIMDWQLDAFASTNVDVHFVGGYDINKVIENYPDLTYHFNESWNKTGCVASLLIALKSIINSNENPNDIYISYSDILFTNKLVEKLNKISNENILISIDLHSISPIKKNVETYFYKGVKSEFIGLIRVPSNMVQNFYESINTFENSESNLFLSELLIKLEKKNNTKIQAVDAEGEWAHTEDSESISRFILGTKASTLNKLKNKLKYSKILPLQYITRSQYNISRQSKINEIISFFKKCDKLIVRSSAKDEDTFDSAKAGCYLSILNVDINYNDLSEKIKSVFDSYSNPVDNDEVLIQPQLQNVKTIGVIFTRSLELGSPSRIFNYSNSSDTAAITSGSDVKNFKFVVSRNINIENKKKLPKLCKQLIKLSEEIEDICHYDSLDIEFAVTDNEELITLQVRPLVIKNNYLDHSKDMSIFDSLNSISNVIKGLNKPPYSQFGNGSMWSVMSDWNPAEIIGPNPSPLALDLYRKIITDDTWSIQRYQVGYRDLRGWPLIRSFGGKAYVDVRASINSFIPSTLKDSIVEKIVNYGMGKLRNKPSLHDKIEFQILPTCLDFDFDNWIEEYTYSNILKSNELDDLKLELSKVTSTIIEKTPDWIEKARNLELKESKSPKVYDNYGEWIRNNISICKNEGALYFAHLARAGFVAVAILKSAVKIGILSKKRYEILIESIPGLGKIFTDAVIEVKKGKLQRNDLIEKFGHLRPGTYDINTPSYKEKPEIYIDPIIENVKQVNRINFEWTNSEFESLSQKLLDIDLKINPNELLQFIRNAIYGREYSKFVFTKYVSKILDSLKIEAKKYKVEYQKLDCMPLEFWLQENIENWGHKQRTNMIQIYTNNRYQMYKLSSLIMLPSLITQPSEIFSYEIPSSEPSFITNNQVTAPLKVIKPGETLHKEDVINHIVAIVNADPGFDYLFALGITGLITAYGGPNSHMAMRASEFSVPAVIGIGPNEMAKLKSSMTISINCLKQLWRIENIL